MHLFYRYALWNLAILATETNKCDLKPSMRQGKRNYKSKASPWRQYNTGRQDVVQSAVHVMEITTISSVTISSIWHKLCSRLFMFWKISNANLVALPTDKTTNRLVRCKEHLVPGLTDGRNCVQIDPWLTTLQKTKPKCFPQIVGQFGFCQFWVDCLLSLRELMQQSTSDDRADTTELVGQLNKPCQWAVTEYQWWAKSNRDSIQSRFELQRRFDSNIVQFNSSIMRFDTDSIQILTIRFKRHAIWTEISKSWLKLNTHSHYSLLSQILSSYVWFYHHWCMPAIICSLNKWQFHVL